MTNDPTEIIEETITKQQKRPNRWSPSRGVKELLFSRVLRQAANGMVSVVSVLFLYDSGYSVLSICLLYAVYSLYKSLIAYPGALLISKIGPKHSIIVANLAMAPTLVILSFLNELSFVAIIAYFALYGISITFYRMGYLVGFSQVKSSRSAGKELGVMSSLDKIAAAVAPAVGGVVAAIIHPQAAMWLGAILFIVSAIPLMTSPEIRPPKSRLEFRKFPWRIAMPSLVADGMVGFDGSLRIVVLPLFLAIVVFAGSGGAAYASVGVLTSMVLIVGIVMPIFFGSALDRNHGRKLFTGSTFLASIVHIVRPFMITPVGAAAAGLASEASSVGYEVSFLRGMLDIADRTKHPVTYLFLMEVTQSIGSAVFFALSAIIIYFAGLEAGFILMFWLAAIGTLGILSAKFPIFKK